MNLNSLTEAVAPAILWPVCSFPENPTGGKTAGATKTFADAA